VHDGGGENAFFKNVQKYACILLFCVAQGDLRGFYAKSDAVQRLGTLRTKVSDACKYGGDEHINSILEFSILKVVEKMSWDLHRNSQATLSSVGIPQLLDLCIAGARHKYISNYVPYRIFEDLVEGQTIVMCEKIWALLESRKAQLTTVDKNFTIFHIHDHSCLSSHGAAETHVYTVWCSRNLLKKGRQTSAHYA
jgi:hypothetical protein